LRTWARALQDPGDSPGSRVDVINTFSLTDNVNAQEKNRSESWKFEEMTLFLPDVASTLGSSFSFKFTPSDESFLEYGPMELLVDMPIDLGCYRVADEDFSLGAGAGATVPAACLTSCLASNPGNRLSSH